MKCPHCAVFCVGEPIVILSSGLGIVCGDCEKESYLVNTKPIPNLRTDGQDDRSVFTENILYDWSLEKEPK